MQIDIDLTDDRWVAVGLEDICERAALAVLDRLEIDAEDCEMSVLGCDDARIRELNADFREKDKATNVLSWPADERAAEAEGAMPDTPEPDVFGSIELGDIAISYDTCAREAKEAGKPIQDHTMHLMVHGVLHLLGFDHINDPDAELMEGLETEILCKMGLPDPYSEY
ncbi:rRNA maturation RNase YbeY [Marivivens niveibacter]|uniref:Endoribonuclease YbeY n=1 Tax=Marivivens niveibacter TaxID=1930667 RepID=A0A251X027_9RHOB|nr:rRNA maturation RNase YbeY [Marivivens niveibacter]OUD09982.1 rRNA maturation RNase YbeY [Marivivens niveibacter]